VPSGGGRVRSTLLTSGFGGLGLKTISDGFTGLGLKTRAEVLRRNGRHVVALGSSRRGEATERRRSGRQMKITPGWTITPLG
jgi:hypothetical protein